MSTDLRIVLTGHDPTLTPDTMGSLSQNGYAVESTPAAAIDDAWTPHTVPTVVCFGLSRG